MCRRTADKASAAMSELTAGSPVGATQSSCTEPQTWLIGQSPLPPRHEPAGATCLAMLESRSGICRILAQVDGPTLQRRDREKDKKSQ
jgi:hypothetical protein